MTKNALVLFAKAPIPGKVKTRLLSHFSSEQASGLYQAFVEDLVESLCSLPYITLFLSCPPPMDHPFFSNLAKKYPLTQIEQKGEDLGKRMEKTFIDLGKMGIKKRVIIGADSPTLSPLQIQEAFEKLNDYPLTLGPSHDGGYYLIGISRETPPIFSEITWGTNQVMTQTLKKLGHTTFKPHLLPFWYDVDTPEDVYFLKEHLNHLNQLGQTIPKRTNQYLENLLLKN
ncbi:MAG TPA: TIGR04282 family arsenosugar biosynthesis glycosyltransferase [Nitrospiria bacterium]|jgi:hypothetical protein